MKHLQAKDGVLAVQHLLAMFGATVLVPLLTGFSPSVALFCAGLGTLIFHLFTKGMVPVFLGSSFAFIGALSAVAGAKGIPAAQGGIIVAGLLYFVFALFARLLGADFIRRLFPPVVTGPVIIVIGLSLTGVGVKDAFGFTDNTEFTGQTWINILTALFTFAVVVFSMNKAHGFLKLIPILIGIASGYMLCVILHACGVFPMDFSSIKSAAWVNVPYRDGFFSLPSFDMESIVMIAPIALVTFMEHIGDITTNGAVVGKDFFKDPGLHRTLLGDGAATLAAGFLGGPPNTTYSENTGVLATTGNYNPAVLRVAAIFAMTLALIGKFGAVLLSIPIPVKGGVELVLFGMIAAIGVRIICESKIDMTKNRNLSIMAGTLCVGLGVGSLGGIPVQFGHMTLNVSALFVATAAGVLMNLIIPERKNDNV